MRIHNFPGFFVDIEGIDGSGANTQAGLVSENLKKLGIRPHVTKEPTSGPVGQLIRQILKKNPKDLSPTSLRLLFAADCSLHLDKEIIPRLKKGEMVICDRYAWASIAYGSIDLPKEWLFELNRDLIFPDLTIFIDVVPEICLERLAKEKEGLQLFEEEEKLNQTFETYHWLAFKYWWAPIFLVDGQRKKEDVTGEIINHIKNHPKFKKIQ